MFGLITAFTGKSTTTTSTQTTSKPQTTAKPKTTKKPTTTVSSASCSQNCVEEFKGCYYFFKRYWGKSCNQAYNICRSQINYGYRRLAGAGCKKKCKDTKKMIALKSCKKTTGWYGVGSQATLGYTQWNTRN